MVDKEAGNIEKPCEPSDHEDQVQGFYK